VKSDVTEAVAIDSSVLMPCEKLSTKGWAMNHASLSTSFFETKPFTSVELNFSEAKVDGCHFDALVI
tara:strand:- start:43 stop:243 length:201 start_codon:yes stop_codon:yes gene_type:complete